MKRFYPILKWFLIVWGCVSFLGVIVVGSVVAYKLGPGNKAKIGAASTHDVRFVLNGCELGENRITKVIHSYVSARSFTGDHLDAYAIQINHVDIKELTSSQDRSHGKWYRGDQLSGVLSDAIAMVGSWVPNNEAPWFPTEKEIRSEKYYVYPWSIYCHGVEPGAAELIFVRPSDNMVFFFDGKL